MQIPSAKPVPTAPAAAWAPLALGFRPFFLLAAAAAVALMAVWLLAWRTWLGLPAHFDLVSWHAHEMLFGYVGAVIAGFLLTAVRNWSGVQTWTGWRLAALAGVWLAGRLIAWLPGVGPVAIAIVDIAFLPLLALSLARPLLADRNRVNRVFVVLLAGLALANLLSHLQINGLLRGYGDAHRIAIELVLLLILIVAGRVLPFFARSALPGFDPTSSRSVEILSYGLLSAIILVEFAGVTPTWPMAILWLSFAVAQGIRVHGWFDVRALRIPILAVLYAAYAWLPVGALLFGLAMLGSVPVSAALHALTVGVIGVFTLGMMARITRAHTGRAINVSSLTAFGFAVLNIAAVVRVFGPLIDADLHALWIDLSGALWVLAFAVFVWRYAAKLMRPRIDGTPG